MTLQSAILVSILIQTYIIPSSASASPPSPCLRTTTFLATSTCARAQDPGVKARWTRRSWRGRVATELFICYLTCRPLLTSLLTARDALRCGRPGPRRRPISRARAQDQDLGRDGEQEPRVPGVR
ncbi:hypothetical protein C8Q74DRAFT_275369 [Fomes fomentarius]|nr:hypothetical protein C8Q74DRAFT_275369 [Fomes fomentarius]